MSVQVLNELYAGNGQIGYLGEMRLDAKVVRADAFRALKDDGT
jgi:HK97 family phage major capsid protein